MRHKRNCQLIEDFLKASKKKAFSYREIVKETGVSFSATKGILRKLVRTHRVDRFAQRETKWRFHIKVVEEVAYFAWAPQHLTGWADLYGTFNVKAYNSI